MWKIESKKSICGSEVEPQLTYSIPIHPRVVQSQVYYNH